MMAMESMIKRLNIITKPLQTTKKLMDTLEQKISLVNKSIQKLGASIDGLINKLQRLLKLFNSYSPQISKTKNEKSTQAVQKKIEKMPKQTVPHHAIKNESKQSSNSSATKIATKIKNAVKSIPEKFDEAHLKVLQIEAGLMNGVNNIPSKFDEAYTKVLEMEIKLSSVINSIPSKFEEGKNKASEMAAKVKNAVKSIPEKFDEAHLKVLQIEVGLMNSVNNIPAKFNEAKEKLSKSIPKIFAKAKSDATSIASKIGSGFKSIPSKLGQAKKSISSIASKFSEKVKSIPEVFNKFKGGISEKFQKAKDIWDATGAKGVEINSAESAVKGMAGGQSEQVMGTIDKFNKQSLFNRKDALMAGESFMPMIAGSDNMSESMSSLLDMTERLAMSNKEMDFGKAAEAVKSAFGSGDFSALSENFNIPESDIQNFKLQPYIESGDVQGFSQQFNQMLAGRGIGDTYIDEMKNSTQGSLTKVKSSWDDIVGGIQQKLAEGLQPVIERINEMLQSPETQTIIENIGVLIQIISDYVIQLLAYLEPLFGVANQILTFVIENANVLIPILLFLVTVVGAVVMIQKILNIVMMANPIVLIITAVIMLIGVFVLLIATLEPVRDKFISVGQAIIGFVGKVVNTFLEGLAGLVRGIFLFAQNAINALLNIFINPFIDGLNLIIEVINFITGKQIPMLDHLSVNFQSKSEEISDAILNKKMDVEGAKDAFGNLIEGGSKNLSKVLDKFNVTENVKATQANENNDYSRNIENNTNLYSFKNTPTNPINNNTNMQSNMQSHNNQMTKDDVSVNNQDLQLMKELAEREAIQKVVSVKPTVDIGDVTVNKDADADRLLGEITEKLIEEVTNSAKGVYC